MSRVPVLSYIRTGGIAARVIRHHPSRSFSAAAATAEPKKRERSFEKKEPSSSLVMNLFSGQLNTETIFPFPSGLDSEQLEMMNMLLEPSKKIFGAVDFLEAERNEKFPDDFLENVKLSGGFGAMVPPEYGGVGMTNTMFARMGEMMGSQDLAFGIVLGASQSIGYKGIVLFGTKEQKEKYLPKLASGEQLAAFCLTEPGAGSDASSIQCRAVKSADGSYVLNGSKCWISNGGTAEVMTVFAKMAMTNDKGETKDKVTAFIVERAFGGVTNGPPEKKMGIKASNTSEVFYDNVKIPAGNVIGQEGDGFKVAMNILNSGRFGMQATLAGTQRDMIRKAIDHARTRKQFGDTLQNFGTIQEKIARMAMAHYISETFGYLISGIMDSGHKEFQLEAAIGKIVASEAAWFVADEAIQILGGMGYMQSPGLEKQLRDIRIFRIFEGTNEILRLFVALTGLQAAGAHLKDLQRALKNPASNIGTILEEGTKRLFKAVGVSGGPNFSDKVCPQLRPWAAVASKNADNFGSSVEYLLRKYNKDIIHEQFLLNRLANSAIDIFTMMSVLSRATSSVNNNFNNVQHEINMVNVICSEANDRINGNLAALRSSNSLKNFNLMKSVSQEMFKAGGVAHIHPVDKM